MQLVQISETVWVNPMSVVAVNQADDGRVWVEMYDTGMSDADERFRGDAAKLIDRLNEQLESDRLAIEVRIRQAAEIVVQAIADGAAAIGAEIENLGVGPVDASGSLGAAIVAGIERATQRKDGG